MRAISIPYTETHSVSIDLRAAFAANGPAGFVSLGVTDTGQGSKMLAIARDNAGKIIYGTASLESLLQQGITNYLFGIGHPCTEQRNFFGRYFMESSYLEYNAKLTIYVKVLEAIGLIKHNKAREDLETRLRRVMRYRNAMAHGKMSVNNGEVQIEYFQGERKVDKMDESYLLKMEAAFKDAYEAVTDFNKKISETILRPVADPVKVQ